MSNHPSVYRRKYVPIVALQYTGENHSAIEKFLGSNFTYWTQRHLSTERWVGTFRSGSYDGHVYIGDHVVQLENGIFHVYSHRSFIATFEREPE